MNLVFENQRKWYMNKVVFGNSYLLLFILTTFMFEGCLVYEFLLSFVGIAECLLLSVVHLNFFFLLSF